MPTPNVALVVADPPVRVLGPVTFPPTLIYIVAPGVAPASPPGNNIGVRLTPIFGARRIHAAPNSLAPFGTVGPLRAAAAKPLAPLQKKTLNCRPDSEGGQI
jgi:hypothetical protein